jgi:signal transduction histidine kinase
MKVSTLTEKLILYFVLLGIGSITIITTVSFYNTREALMSRTFDQLTSLRIVKKNQIRQFYADRTRDITLLAMMAGSIPPTSPLTDEGRSHREWEKLIAALRLPGNYFTAFYILGREGILMKGGVNDTLVVCPPVIPENILSALRAQVNDRNVVITDFLTDKHNGEPFQLIAIKTNSPAKDNKSGGTILILAVSIQAINTIMLNNDPLNGLGSSGETYLVGPDYLMRSTSRFQPNSILRTLVKTQSATDAISGISGAIATNDYRGVPVLSSYSLIDVPGLNWAILAEIDLKEAMIPIYETRTRILLLSVIIMVIFFALVWFISRRITKPLILLRDATVNLGKGTYDIDLPVNTRDEIGSLTNSFNIMARQIKEKTTELQSERFGRIQSVFDGEEMERQRLSRELHDGIGQSLIAIKLRLENLLYQDGKDIRNSIQELKNYFDQIIDEVRRISNNLMPSVLEVFSIPIAFRNLFSETEEHSGLRIHFEAKGNFDELDKKIKTYIYRLTQEALNNIVKHAEAREVKVTLYLDTDLLTLMICDDGKGFSPETIVNNSGNGIHNMRERAILLQGQIDIRSTPLQGTTIILKVPIITTYAKNQNFSR